MIPVDAGSGVPLEEQIRTGMKDLVLRGLLKPGDPLPQAAKLAESLRISPAAVSSAYGSMIKDGFLAPGAEGPLISDQAWNQAARSLVDAVQDFLKAIGAGRKLGLAWTDLEAALQMMKSEEAGTRNPAAADVLRKLGFFARSRATEGIALCPFCREALRAEDVACCAVCGTAHHAECWNETGRCSVYGCKGTVQFPMDR